MADTSSCCGSSTSPRTGSNKRSSLTVSVDALSVLQDEYNRKADELVSELQASRAKQERGFLKDAGVDLLDTYAVDKALSTNRNNRLLLNKPRDKRIEELSKELEGTEKSWQQREQMLQKRRLRTLLHPPSWTLQTSTTHEAASTFTIVTPALLDMKPS